VNASSILLVLLVLACPLAMAWMMRGGHGHGGHDHSAQASGDASLTELHRRRAELDRLIDEREGEEREPKAGLRQ
jgi:Protein of unknown function (DUF2933)